MTQSRRRGALAPLLIATLLASGCDRTPVREVVGGDAGTGKELIRRFGCGGCHVIPGIRGADGTLAAPLTAFSERAWVAGVTPNSPEALVSFLVNPRSVNPASRMPDLGTSEDQARHMAAYLYTLR
jgi:cytochrome c